MPAVEAEAKAPVEKEYEVIGSHKVFGNEPGSKFKATLDPIQEGRLVRSRSIAITGQKPKAPTVPELRAKAAELGISIPKGSKKPDIERLLAEADQG